MVVVGGYDDFQEEGSTEFANMNATSNAISEMEQGREPGEMSRPSTTTRSGFMESQGAGMQVLASAALAIKMGLPIYGIVAFTNTATDREGRCAWAVWCCVWWCSDRAVPMRLGVCRGLQLCLPPPPPPGAAPPAK